MLRQAAYACFLLGVFLLGFSLNASLAPAVPPGANFVPGEVILKFKSNASDHDKAQIYAELGGAKLKGFGRIKAELRRVETMSVEDAVSRYHTHPKIEYIEPNYIVQANEIPNDPRFPELYGLNNTCQTGGTADADIDATEAWDVFTGSHNVLIGVIDTGVDYNHPDLAANIWTNPGEIPGNSVDDDNNGYVDDVHGYDFVNNDGDPMDDHGHGSHCSGTIGGVGNNAPGAAYLVDGFYRTAVDPHLRANLAVFKDADRIVGYVLGELIMAGFTNEVYRLRFVVTAPTVAWSWLTVVAATIVSALLVRRRLDRLDLVAVLKTSE